ncbi:CitMHS family transporter [Sporolactobacillus sp. THM19-2]|uniref:CitMHS family transporter n=1 Tax=Sporolactobacillus sp. THM19-2 TaxID=2511171 RepID=UPI00101E91E2|nr:citrate:proton symporter [Sporolactobacillus sp. THM19-2]RYL92680.1 citrate transporter [Sporolactobacillus sp. THM19-2]
MLALLGFLTIVVFMYLIMSRRLSALIALMLVPTFFAIIGGFSKDIGGMMLKGIQGVAPTGIMIMFAILYFGIMIDSGLFDPLIMRILKVVKGDPLKIALGTALLAAVVSLDGDGTTTYMITVSAMLPLYKRIGMKPIILAGIAISASGVMNLLPWGGPTARVLASLNQTTGAVFIPVIPAMAAGLLFVLFIAFHMGRKERKRIGVLKIDGRTLEEQAASAEAVDLKRPKLVWVNGIMTILLLVCLIIELIPVPALFMLAFALAAMINYPNLKLQKERVQAYAGNALAVVSMIFAAGIFTGVFTGTKMVDALAAVLIDHVPASLGPYWALITALISGPFTFFMSNDAFYFGIVPLIAKTAASFGVDPAMIGRASLLGLPVHLFSPLVPSTYLLVGMVGAELGELQRGFLKWAFGTALVMVAAALLLGIISL